jgi:hypothetical protein
MNEMSLHLLNKVTIEHLCGSAGQSHTVDGTWMRRRRDGRNTAEHGLGWSYSRVERWEARMNEQIGTLAGLAGHTHERWEARMNEQNGVTADE